MQTIRRTVESAEYVKAIFPALYASGIRGIVHMDSQKAACLAYVFDGGEMVFIGGSRRLFDRYHEIAAKRPEFILSH